jgi:pimeloyl-ACP methyl ester carboxylesterase
MRDAARFVTVGFMKSRQQRKTNEVSAEARTRMLAGLPIAERRLDVAGTSTTVLEAGEGPPLVLLHGGIECGAAYWAPVITRLAESHYVVAPDVPGLGESEPVPRLHVDAFARWFAELLHKTHAKQPVLVAHSLLGSLAARFAARHGHVLDRLVLYGAPAVGSYRIPMGLKYVAIRFGIRPTAPNAERYDRFALFDLDATREQAPDWYKAFEEYARSRARVPHVKRTMRHLIGSETKQIPNDELYRIAIPTALLWGRHDRMVPLHIAESASNKHVWPLHIIEGAAHVPHIEQPDVFVSTLSTIERESTIRRENPPPSRPPSPETNDRKTRSK